MAQRVAPWNSCPSYRAFTQSISQPTRIMHRWDTAELCWAVDPHNVAPLIHHDALSLFSKTYRALYLAGQMEFIKVEFQEHNCEFKIGLLHHHHHHKHYITCHMYVTINIYIYTYYIYIVYYHMNSIPISHIRHLETVPVEHVRGIAVLHESHLLRVPHQTPHGRGASGAQNTIAMHRNVSTVMIMIINAG